MNKAIFLDRDGTINFDSGYVYKIEDLVLLDGVKNGLQSLHDVGYLFILVTNQSGIARGYYTISDTEKFNTELAKQCGVDFDAIFICPHSTEDECDCRKPSVSQSIKTYIEENIIDIKNSYMIGDKDADIEFGQNLGCKTVRVTSGQYENQIQADYNVKSVSDFVTLLNQKGE